MNNQVPTKTVLMWMAGLMGLIAFAFSMYEIGNLISLLLKDLDTRLTPGTRTLVLGSILALIALMFWLVPKPNLRRKSHGLWWKIPALVAVTALTGILAFIFVQSLVQLIGLSSNQFTILIGISLTLIILGGILSRLKYKWPTLVSASHNGDISAVTSLIEEGVDLNTKGPDGNTALMMAAGGGHLDILRALLNAGADVNIRNDNGATALMFATEQGNVEIVEALLVSGSEVKTKDTRGKTALDSAYINGSYDNSPIVEMLKRYLTKV
jgi:hypothetical protein